MQTLFEVLFILALVLPPAAVVGGIAALLGSSFVYLLPHGAVGSHRPVRG